MKRICKLDDFTICEHDANNAILVIDHDPCISEIIINFCPVCGFQPERLSEKTSKDDAIV